MCASPMKNSFNTLTDLKTSAGNYRYFSLQALADQTNLNLERLPLSIKQFFARHLLANTWFAQKVVMDRWFLHRQQAPLTLD